MRAFVEAGLVSLGLVEGIDVHLGAHQLQELLERRTRLVCTHFGAISKK
jgi:hypothetical protein